MYATARKDIREIYSRMRLTIFSWISPPLFLWHKNKNSREQL
jgi:hypothetical protein